MALEWNETKTTSSRIWTQVIDSISYEDKRYNKFASSSISLYEFKIGRKAISINYLIRGPSINQPLNITFKNFVADIRKVTQLTQNEVDPRKTS